MAARIRTALTIVILVMANAGCGDPQGTSSAPSTTIAPVWKVSAPMVEVGPPDPMLLPSPTPGVTITGVDLPADDVLAPDMGPDRSAQTLWADPTVADPMQGRVLLVGRTELSDTDGGFALKGRPVAIGDSKATIGRRGPLVIVSWPLPVTECACDQAVVVAGRNLSEDQVLLAARGARARDDQPSIDPSGLPAGLRSLGTLSGFGLDDPWSTTPRRLWILLRSNVVELRIVDGDERLPIHLRFWIDDRITLEYEDEPSRPVSVSSVGSHTVIAHPRGGPGVDTAPLDSMLDSLHEVSDAELNEARRRAVDRPADAADRCDGEGTIGDNAATFAGSVDGERWSITLSSDASGYSSCHGGAGTSTGGGGGPLPAPGLADEVRVLGGVTSIENERVLHIVSGDVPEQAAQVTVTVGDLPPVRAQIANNGPAPGRRWFATARVGNKPTDQVTVVAHDRTGEPVARSSP